MTVRTARLAKGSTGTANVTVTAYVCPSGRTAIVKSVFVSNASGSSNQVILAASSGALFVNLHVGALVGGSGVLFVEPYLVLEPGDELVLNSSQTNGANYWVSGVELDGVAP